MRYYTSDDIWHYGIKGMRWGVRRNRSTLGRSPRQSIGNTTSKKVARKPMSEMTDAELRAHTERMRLERAYKEEYDRTHVSAKSIVSSVVKNINTIAVTTANLYNAKKAVERLLHVGSGNDDKNDSAVNHSAVG